MELASVLVASVSVSATHHKTSFKFCMINHWASHFQWSQRRRKGETESYVVGQVFIRSSSNFKLLFHIYDPNRDVFTTFRYYPTEIIDFLTASAKSGLNVGALPDILRARTFKLSTTVISSALRARMLKLSGIVISSALRARTLKLSGTIISSALKLWTYVFMPVSMTLTHFQGIRRVIIPTTPKNKNKINK